MARRVLDHANGGGDIEIEADQVAQGAVVFVAIEAPDRRCTGIAVRRILRLRQHQRLPGPTKQLVALIFRERRFRRGGHALRFDLLQQAANQLAMFGQVLVSRQIRQIDAPLFHLRVVTTDAMIFQQRPNRGIPFRSLKNGWKPPGENQDHQKSVTR